MPRRRTPPQPDSEATRHGSLVTIHPNDVFLAADVQAALRLNRSTIRREVREGRLRVSKRAGRYYFLGSWLLEWIAGGEVERKARAAALNGAPAQN
jgi:hypothetical protein